MYRRSSGTICGVFRDFVDTSEQNQGAPLEIILPFGSPRNKMFEKKCLRAGVCAKERETNVCMYAKDPDSFASIHELTWETC